MFIHHLVVGPIQANCYIVAADKGKQCVIIDPGMDATDRVQRVVVDHDLLPTAVLATHGHFDHVADAAALADGFGIPVYIHPADRHLLSDPAAGLSADMVEWLQNVFAQGCPEPAKVEDLPDAGRLELAGLTFDVIVAPGHTPGSVLSTLVPLDEDDAPVVFTGDVLFAGSIGRTDMPGSSQQVMLASLAGPVLGLPDAAVILPGHGAQTVMAQERASNPYLQPRFLYGK